MAEGAASEDQHSTKKLGMPKRGGQRKMSRVNSTSKESRKNHETIDIFAQAASNMKGGAKSLRRYGMLHKAMVHSGDEAGGSERSASSSEDEERAEVHKEVMRMARCSTRLTLTPAKLIESLTSKWFQYSEKMVVTLIENAADVNARLEEPWDNQFDGYVQTLGATPLHFAARRGLLEVCRALLDHNADTNAATRSGITPIMAAVMFDEIEAIKMLFQAKASVLQQDQAGFCAVDLAVLEGRQDVQEVIMACEKEEEHAREEIVTNEMRELGLDEPDVVAEEDASSCLVSSALNKLASIRGGRTSRMLPGRTARGSTTSTGTTSAAARIRNALNGPRGNFLRKQGAGNLPNLPSSPRVGRFSEREPIDEDREFAPAISRTTSKNSQHSLAGVPRLSRLIP